MTTDDASIMLQRRFSKIYKRLKTTKHNIDIADDNMNATEANFTLRRRKQ